MVTQLSAKIHVDRWHRDLYPRFRKLAQFDDQCKNTCPLCRKANYKSLELSSGLSSIIRQKVEELDIIEDHVHHKKDQLCGLGKEELKLEDKIKRLKTRINQLKMEKRDYKYSNIANKLNWENDPQLGIQYWEDKQNKKDRGVEKKQKNYHKMLLDEYKDLAHQFNLKGEYIKPKECLS